jgi:Wax ester synthase/diacylglycerol acyltransferase catalytic domain/Domain of unknown function (DUF3471)
VAAPGGQAQPLAVFQDLGRRLDTARPLWELWLQPGPPDRRVGAYLRLHHVLADGPAAAAALGMGYRIAVVVLSNSASRIEDLGFHLLDQRAELTEERQQIDLPAEVLDRYVGLYQLGPHATVTVTQTDGGQVAEATGLGVAPIYPATETEFFVKVIPVELTFQLDPRDAPTGVVVRFAGRQMRGSKIR